MESFLDRVVAGIQKSNHKIDKSIFVLPNALAVRQFRLAISKVIKKPMTDDRILSFDRLIFRSTGYERCENIDLLYTLYDIYSKLSKGDVDSFDQFLRWGPMIINEFENLDAHDADVKEIFTHLAELSAIDQFVGSDDSEPTVTPVKDYRKFNLLLIRVYEELQQELKNHEKAYYGLAVRKFKDDINDYLKRYEQHHFFIGFNALTKAEETILRTIVEQGRATIYWDVDKKFYDNKNHPAGHYLRQYVDKWDYFKNESNLPLLQSHFENKKDIHILDLPKSISQVKSATQIVQNKSDQKNPLNSAIILGDESLLIPTVSTISSTDVAWNTSMGYSLQNTDVYTFFSSFLDAHIEADQIGFSHATLLKLSNTCYFGKVLKRKNYHLEDLLNDFTEKNKRTVGYVSLRKLIRYEGGDKIYDLFFESFKTDHPINFLKRLISICDFFIANRQPDINKLYKELGANQDPTSYYFQRFKNLLLNINWFENRYKFIRKLTDLRYLIDSLVGNEKIEFSGESGKGVQIMGILDSRLLDYDRVVITNLNEGILPRGNKSNRWIPTAVRELFKIPTYIEDDYLYAYHFFRVIQRASKIYLLYNKDLSGANPGEKSRFIRYLEYFPEPNHTVRNITSKSKIVNNDFAVSVLKNGEILEDLERIIFSGGLSSSALSLYLTNPFQFYEKYILKLKDPKIFEYEISPLNRGNVVHDTLETLFKPLVGKELRVSDYNEIRSNLKSTLLDTYAKKFKGDDIRRGVNYLFTEIITEHVDNYLKLEKESLEKGQSIKILAVESSLKATLNEKGYRLYGKIDRIDLIDGERIRLIDYKTGKFENRTLQNPEQLISKLREKEYNTTQRAQLQLLFYAVLCSRAVADDTKDDLINFYLGQDFRTYIENDQVDLGIISFKTRSPRFEQIKFNYRQLDHKTLLSYLPEFEMVLAECIDELLDSELPFVYER